MKTHRGAAVDDGPLQSKVEYLLGVAVTLRGLADQLQYDFRRAEQLHSLAAGFDRFATRLEQEADAR